MRYHLFQKFFGKIVKIKETSFLSCLVDSLTHTTVTSNNVMTYPSKNLVNHCAVVAHFDTNLFHYGRVCMLIVVF